MTSLTGTDILNDKAKVRDICDQMHEQYPDIKFPDVFEDVLFAGRMGRELLTNFKAIRIRGTGTNPETGLREPHIYTVDLPTDKYTLVPHEVLLHSMVGACPPEYGTPQVNMHFYGLGEKGRAVITFPEVKLEIRSGDAVNPRLLGQNSYDRSWLYNTSFGAMQVVCTNGMVAFRVRDSVSKRHIGEVGVEAMKVIMGESMEAFSDQVGLWKSWAELALPFGEGFEKVVEALPFSENERAKMMELPLMGRDTTLVELQRARKATVWDLHSAATQFATHEVRSDLRKVELEDRIATVLGKAFTN